MTTHLDVVIVGGGAAGLATAYWLQRAGLRYRLLEAEHVGHVWTRHYDSLRLHTLKAVSALPGLTMPDDYPDFPTGPQVADYLRGYAQRMNLAVEEEAPVRAVKRREGRWHMATERETYDAKVLVMATGIWGRPYCPPVPGFDAFRGDGLHSSEYRNPDRFQGQRVLVLGVGNSGAEIAAELGRAGVETTLSVRGGVTFVPNPHSAQAMRASDWLFRHLPRDLGNALLARIRPDFSSLGLPRQACDPLNAYPVVGFGLVAAVRDRRVRVVGPLSTLTPTGARFADGREIALDTVIRATGFRPVLDVVRPWLSFDARDWPVLNGGRSTRTPSLWAVGLTYPTTAGWLQSIGRLTRQAVTHIRREV
jgi:cation diffusion facilitator CzcD-associated flavoprotein CzcO